MTPSTWIFGSCRGRLRSKLTIAVFVLVLLSRTVSFSQDSGDAGTVQVLPVQGDVYLATSRASNAVLSVGKNGVLVIDTMTQDLAGELVAQIHKLAPDKPIVYIVNTHFHADHTGGNQIVAAAGPKGGVGNAPGAFIFAHWGVLSRMTAGNLPSAVWPHETFLTPSKELYFNNEAVQILHQPNAHTDGDALVFFRKSDVIAAGDVYNNTSFPVIQVDQGGSLNGSIAALNRIIEIAVPEDGQEGGTQVIPGHGRVADEADVVEYRDMATILRDRMKDAIVGGLTLEQAKAAHLTLDYDGRYGKGTGPGNTNGFLEAAYRSLKMGLQTNIPK